MTRIPLRDVGEVVSPLGEHVLVSDEVAAALAAAQPVVALETSLVTHGLPYPHCVDVSVDAAGRIRAGGAVPATIAVSDGHMVVGLSDDEVDKLARARDTVKATRANLSAVIARRQTGGTTVSATMLIANACGISVFSTGGLGGVHRGAAGDVRRSLSGTLDISADLEELSRTPVSVVCAGPKIILDVQLTLEYLETNGVPLMTLGADEVPGFYTRPVHRPWVDGGGASRRRTDFAGSQHPHERRDGCRGLSREHPCWGFPRHGRLRLGRRGVARRGRWRHDRGEPHRARRRRHDRGGSDGAGAANAVG